MSLRAVAFDLDGTLIDSVQDIAEALNAVLADLDRGPYSVAEVRSMVGGGARKLLARALGSDDHPLMERARDGFGAAYGSRLLATTRPYPGIQAALAAVREAKLGIVIATNKPRMFTAPIVEGLGLVELGVAGWAAADEVPEKKPDPSVVRLALERAGLGDLQGPELAYVGDMPVDVHTARALGARAVGVSWGFDPKGCLAAGPDRWVTEAAALIGALGE